MQSRTRLLAFFALVVLSAIFAPTAPRAQAAPSSNPILQWNTFLGGTDNDEGTGIAVDASGNAYVIGHSYTTWGSPIRPFTTGSYDAFVAKLSSSGSLVWNTFLGAADGDDASGIVLDSSGNIYVVGSSQNSWGDAPKQPNSWADAFVAKLDNNGTLLWNTFLGGTSSDEGTGIALDASGNIYVSGSSYSDWGGLRPQPYTASRDGFVAKLNSNGNLAWNSFLGGSSDDRAYGVAADASGNTYVVGNCNASWGSSPRRSFSGISDAFVAKLDDRGFLQWNTFLGSTKADLGRAIVRDANSSIYIAGMSYGTWGDAPRRPYSALDDIFVAGLSDGGDLQWNTFLGGASTDYATRIAVDPSSNLYVTGHSGATWGSPASSYMGFTDATVSNLDANGHLLWNTFLGSTGEEYGNGVVVNASGNVYVAGRSTGTWGSPVQSPHGAQDAFVAMIANEHLTNTYLPFLQR